MAKPIPIPAIWIPDERASRCYGCRSDFSWLNRKHHCRICGRIFCGKCSQHKILVPSFVRHFIAKTPGNTQNTNYNEEKRVCTQCYDSTLLVNNTKKYIYMFASMPLLFKELIHCRNVCKDWKDSIDTIFSLWATLKYKIPHSKYTSLEIKLLRTHYKETYGHNHLMVKCIKAIPELYIPYLNNDEEKLLYNCKYLKCDQFCSQHINIFDMLEIYTHLFPYKKEVDRWLKKHWKHYKKEDIINLMPWWVHIFRTRPQIAVHIFGDIIKNDLELSYSLLFECNLQSISIEFKNMMSELMNRLMDIIDKNIVEDWKISMFFMMKLEQIGRANSEMRRSRIAEEIHSIKKTIRCPWNPTIIIQQIMWGEIVMIASSSKPVKIPIKTSTGYIDVLFKKEDIRTDKLTMHIAYWIEQITQHKVNIPQYHVMPWSNTCGFIEIIPNTTTLYDIKHKHKTTLQNFILDSHEDEAIGTVRNIFIKSCTSACVLSYMLGVGDRHLENMLVTEKGELVHIDFSYIMGNDPKHVKAEMRITSDMLDTLGGKTSTSFIAFQELCSDIYKILRTKSTFWYCLFMYLSDASPSIGTLRNRRWKIEEHVLDRLMPGEMDEEASMQIIEVVQRSSQESWGTWASDYVHEIGNKTKEYGVFKFDWD